MLEGVGVGAAVVSGLSDGWGVAVGSSLGEGSGVSVVLEEPEHPGRQMFIPHFTKRLFKRSVIDCLHAVKLKQLFPVQLLVEQLPVVQSAVVQSLVGQAEVVLLLVVVLTSVFVVVLVLLAVGQEAEFEVFPAAFVLQVDF